MISNEILLNSKKFKSNNALNTILGGLFLFLLFLPFPVYEGAGIFALMILISVNGFLEIFEVTSLNHMYGRILLILLFTLFIVIVFFQIYNLVIQEKTNLKKRIKNKYLVFSILQALYFVVVLLIVNTFNKNSGFNEIIGHYYPKVSSFFIIYTFILLALSILQLIHYILILIKLKRTNRQ